MQVAAEEVHQEEEDIPADILLPSAKPKRLRSKQKRNVLPRASSFQHRALKMHLMPPRPVLKTSKQHLPQVKVLACNVPGTFVFQAMDVVKAWPWVALAAVLQVVEALAVFRSQQARRVVRSLTCSEEAARVMVDLSLAISKAIGDSSSSQIRISSNQWVNSTPTNK